MPTTTATRRPLAAAGQALVLREPRPSYPVPDEAALSTLWRRAHTLSEGLVTRDGRRWHVVYPGRPADGAGPDFRDAVFADQDGELVFGDVEIHLDQRDWRTHGHHLDPAYDGVVLHVVLDPGAPPPPKSRVPGSGVRGRGSGERETTASSLTGKHEARERRTTVVKERMDLLELLRKGGMDGDVDFLREALRVLVEGIMDAEVSSRIGAEYGERSPERVTQRNGYRSRAWDTRVGTMELHIPKLREGSYFPSLLEPRRRSERALLAVIQQAYVEGVSTRRVDDLVKALGCDGISKSQVSRICQDLDVVVEGFLGRPLDGGPYPYPYLWLDALTQKVREDGRIVNVSVVVATAVNGEGKREIIGMDVGTSEDGAFWLAFLRSLSARGLGGVELVVSDAHQGLRGAIAAVFGGASWQRCRTHFMTNLLTRVPRRAQPWVATMVRTIYQQPSPDEVHAQLDRVTSQLQDRFPQVASLLDEAGPDILAFSSFPVSHWKKLWSNNPLERLNKEIRRRTDVVGIFPNRPAVRRLVGAVLAEQHDEWAVGRRYLTPAILTFNEALPEADVAEDTAA